MNQLLKSFVNSIPKQTVFSNEMFLKNIKTFKLHTHSLVSKTAVCSVLLKDYSRWEIKNTALILRCKGTVRQALKKESTWLTLKPE